MIMTLGQRIASMTAQGDAIVARLPGSCYSGCRCMRVCDC
jgi:hypothetical protein